MENGASAPRGGWWQRININNKCVGETLVLAGTRLRPVPYKYHSLNRCSLWSDLRQEIRRLAGSRGDTSYLRGGWSGDRKDGPFDGWKANIEMINAL